MVSSVLRQKIVAEALSWEGTLYHDCARVKILRGPTGEVVDRGGVDCAQLVYAIYHAAGLIPEFQLPRYNPQWMLHHREELYLNEVLKWAEEISAPLPGDLVLYQHGRTYSHGALVISWPEILHASSQAGVVMRDLGDNGALAGCHHRYFTLFKDSE